MKNVLVALLLLCSNSILAQPYDIHKFYTQNTHPPTNPREFALYKNRLYFVADSDGVQKLYHTDGTLAGTSSLAVPGIVSYAVEHTLTVCNGLFYFLVRDSLGIELWTSDGTLPGTHMLKDIVPGPADAFYSAGSNSAVVNNKLVFSPRGNGSDYVPWVTDGTAAGTHELIPTSGRLSSASGFFAYKNKVYFMGAEAVHGEEMWCTDGTDTGTHLFKDILPGPQSGRPECRGIFKDRLYFRPHANRPCNGCDDLWVTDGTDTGTHIFWKPISFQGSRPIGMASGIERFYFMAFDTNTNVNIYMMYSSDGTDTGTHALTRCIARWDGGVILNDKFFFYAPDSNKRNRLWVTDGFVAGTHVVTYRISPGGMIVGAPFDSRVYFSATDSINGSELWATDGTDSGTVKIQWPDSAFDPLGNSGMMIAFNGPLYFPATYAGYGMELHTYGPAPLAAKAPGLIAKCFSAYPNPASADLTIQSEASGEGVLMDVEGRVLIRFTILKGKSSVHLPDGLAAGVYFLQGHGADGEGLGVLRILVE